MGLLDMNAQPQRQMMGGLLGGGMAQGGQGIGQSMPQEMMRVVEMIKQAPEEDKQKMAEMIVQSIQGQNKTDQEKQQAVTQFLSALQ